MDTATAATLFLLFANPDGTTTPALKEMPLVLCESEAAQYRAAREARPNSQIRHAECYSKSKRTLLNIAE